MAFVSEFTPIPLESLRREAAIMKADGWRFMQTHAVNTDDGVDLYYSFMKDGKVVNYRVEGVKPDQPVPSITDLFLAAFVFENEARELFGVDMRDIAIDFQGAMYAPAEASPMTFISPEQKAAKEKARKVAAAQATKAARSAGSENGSPATDGTSVNVDDAPSSASSGKRVFTMTPELQARLDAKLPNLSDEKRAKVEAALKARAAEAEAAATTEQAPPSGGALTADSPESAKPKEAPKQDGSSMRVALADTLVDAELEAKLAGMDSARAAKVRAALEGRADESSSLDASGEQAPSNMIADEQIEQLLHLMDDAKAAKVMDALARKGGE